MMGRTMGKLRYARSNLSKSYVFRWAKPIAIEWNGVLKTRAMHINAATHTAKNFASLEKYKCSEHTWL